MWYFALIGAHSFSFEPSIMPRLLLGFLYICIVLKKFAKIILGVFGVVALIVGISSKNSKKRVKELKNDLKDNKKDLDAVRKEKKEVEKDERRDEIFHIQERVLNSTKEPSWEMEIKYSASGEKSEIIVTRNSKEKVI